MDASHFFTGREKKKKAFINAWENLQVTLGKQQSFISCCMTKTDLSLSNPYSYHCVLVDACTRMYNWKVSTLAIAAFSYLP